MQSFFGNSKPARPALVSTVTVKKVVRPGSTSSPARPAQANALPSSSRPKPSSQLSSTTVRRDSKPASSSNPSSKPSSSASPFRSRDAHAHRSTPNTSGGSGHASPARRRKAAEPQRVLPPSDSESESSDDALAPKRRRIASGAATPDLGFGDAEVGRSVFCPTLADARGEWGRGYAGFVTCEEAVRGAVNGWAGGGAFGKESHVIVKDKYQAYFPQEGFENVEPLPTAELRYPSGALEKFVLLTPTSPREYNPVSELRNALRLILKHYIPPSHQHIFGTLDASGEIESSLPSRLHTPTPGALTTPPPDALSPTPHTPTETIGDALRRALAPNRRDGPGLLKAMERLNNGMAELKADGSMAAWLGSAEYRLSKRDWSDLVDFVHDQSYSRVVAPFSDQLEHHPKHPEEVAEAISEKEDAYGELRHAFLSKVIEQTGLGPDSVFVDLGSGVGNCVVQAALQAGCASYGVELLPVPSRCARLQVRECQRRWAMWLLAGNLEAEAHEGDFRRCHAVTRRLSQADVVLVNNEVFPSSLNIDLTQMFLDLKDGATIVSLKPFVTEGFRMNESNCDSFAAILRSTPYPYYSGWVSWKADSGKYYVQVVDRTMRKAYEEQRRRR